MNNRQLQEAIDKTMAFCLNTEGGYSQDRYRETVSKHLERLLHVQVARAQMANTPRITLGDLE